VCAANALLAYLLDTAQNSESDRRNRKYHPYDVVRRGSLPTLPAFTGSCVHLYRE